HFDHRFVVVVDYLAALEEALKGEPAHSGAFAAKPAFGDLDRVAAEYVRGTGLDWADFHKENRYRRVPLPAYPFQRERYSIRREDKAHPATSHRHSYLPVMPAGVPAARRTEVLQA